MAGDGAQERQQNVSARHCTVADVLRHLQRMGVATPTEATTDLADGRIDRAGGREESRDGLPNLGDGRTDRAREGGEKK